ncbi:hypothetical protein NDU88_000575 [Pleurodeles waltl]|uniref:Uncharacterized protein n=1 Tax=Pleurodeles waltl TaxID=8319 RepID=A0AAV7L7B4_PLEWA|nr:hypothetical protein NDU88_000575 [Pleurodeles waltl]
MNPGMPLGDGAPFSLMLCQALSNQRIKVSVLLRLLAHHTQRQPPGTIWPQPNRPRFPQKRLLIATQITNMPGRPRSHRSRAVPAITLQCARVGRALSAERSRHDVLRHETARVPPKKPAGRGAL